MFSLVSPTRPKCHRCHEVYHCVTAAAPQRNRDMALARISHTRCRLRRFKKPTGQKLRAVRSGGSDKRGDAPCRLLQPALRVAFRRASPAPCGSTVCPDTLFAAPMPYLPRRKSNAGGMECEKCGLGRALFTTRSALLIPHHSQLTLVAIRHSLFAR